MKNYFAKHATAVAIVLLFATSAVIYLVQFWLFHDTRDTFFYLLQDWAFLPVQIAVVTIAVGQIIGSREKRERMEKTQMLASTFFSDCGMAMFRTMLRPLLNKEVLWPALKIEKDWGPRDFAAAVEAVHRCPLSFRLSPTCMTHLREIFQEKHMSMMIIISNPALLEHEVFTDMLWAIFHLKDELSARTNFDHLPSVEQEHLNDDMERALRAILVNWIGHMQHIQAEYPFLFLLEIENNPLSPEADNGVGCAC